MDRKSLQSLKLDRRLLGRHGWITQQELEHALQELPDVSSKAAEAPAPGARPPAGGDEPRE